MASIEQRATSWRVRWMQDGRREHESFDDEASALMFKQLVELHRGLPPGWVKGVGFGQTSGEPRSDSVGGIFPGWLASRAATAQAATRARYEWLYARHIEPRWKYRQAASIGYEDVQGLVNDLVADGLSPRTVRHVHTVVTGLMKHARRLGLRTDNPCELTELPRMRRSQSAYLTVGQVQTLLEHAGDIRDLVLVAVGTGLRWGEISALTTNAVVRDHAGTRLRITQAWSLQPDANGVMRHVLGRPKTTRSDREVWVQGSVADLLVDLAGSLEPGSWLFTSPTGQPWRYPNFHESRWSKAVKAARAADPTIPDPLKFHYLRHTYAWFSLSAGADLASLQEQMGHESVQLTKDLYGGLYSEARAASARFSAAMTDQLAVPALPAT